MDGLWTALRDALERFRPFFWVLTAGILGMYFYGLFLGIYAPLELGVLSFACLALLVLFVVHEVLLRRQARGHLDEVDHSDRERRGW